MYDRRATKPASHPKASFLLVCLFYKKIGTLRMSTINLEVKQVNNSAFDSFVLLVRTEEDLNSSVCVLLNYNRHQTLN